MKTEFDTGATGVSVIPVRVAVVAIVVTISPIMVRVIVPVMFAHVITMIAPPITILLFVSGAGFGLDGKNG